MSSNYFRPQSIFAGLIVCALAMAGCRQPQYAYRARVIGGPVQPVPGVALPATPLPVLPGAAEPAAPLQPAPGQPLPLLGGPRPVIPATPQPALPATPGPVVEANRPILPPLDGSSIALKKVGPAQATVGAMVTFRIEIQAASAGARDVTVNDQLSPGLTFAHSNPMATVLGNQLDWRLGDLRGGELRTIEVTFRAEQAGVYNNCAVARTAEGQTSQDCVNTTVLVPELDVRVGVAGSDTVMVGEKVTFQITVTNRSSRPAAGLMITDRFDAGLEHEAAASPIEKELGQLAGGQSTTIGVTFRAKHAGRLCNHVEVRDDAGVRGAAEGCVTALMGAPPPTASPDSKKLPLPPPPDNEAQNESPSTTPSGPQTVRKASAVQIKVVGPATPQQVDAVTEFNIEVTNTGERPLTNVKVLVAPDAALYPVQATDGYDWDDAGKLYWTFPSLAAGKTLRVQLNNRCQKVAAKACVSVQVVTQESGSDRGEACLEIRRGESKLEMKVLALANPVATGKDLTYEVQVSNTGTAAARNVAMLVVVPPEMSVILLGTMGEKTTYGVDGQHVRFKPIAEVQPGEKVTFRIRVRAQKAGEAKLEAVLQSDGMAEPMSVSETTTVVEGAK